MSKCYLKLHPEGGLIRFAKIKFHVICGCSDNKRAIRFRSASAKKLEMPGSPNAALFFSTLALPRSFCFPQHSFSFLLSFLPSYRPSFLPPFTRLLFLAGAGHALAPCLSSPDPELLSLSPFFLLSQSECTFFPKSQFLLQTRPSSLPAKVLGIHLCTAASESCTHLPPSHLSISPVVVVCLPSSFCSLAFCLFCFQSKEDEGFLAKLPTFEKHCDTPAGTFETSMQEDPPPRLTQINQLARYVEKTTWLVALQCLSCSVFLVLLLLFKVSAPNMMWS